MYVLSVPSEVNYSSGVLTEKISRRLAMRKIAVASDDGVHIAGHLGRTLGFIVYEIDGTEIVNSNYIKNDFTGHARGLSHAGHDVDRHGPVVTALQDCEAVISHGMGRRIYYDLQSAGIKPYIVSESDARRAIDLYIEDVLKDEPERGCDH
jgi:predicted Fe-Mo cluster-binding NifX family protein